MYMYLDDDTYQLSLLNTVTMYGFIILSRGSRSTVLPAKSDIDVMFCLQTYQGLRIDTSHVYYLTFRFL